MRKGRCCRRAVDRMRSICLEIHPVRIRGDWSEGWALDWYRVPPSRSGGVPVSEAPITEIGNLLRELKTSSNYANIEPLADVAAAFLTGCNFLETVAASLPVPHSNEDRPFQPTRELAERIAQKVSIPVSGERLRKIPLTAPQTLNKSRVWSGFQVADSSYAGRDLLVVDDTFLTGTTLKAVVNPLYSQGLVRRVYALTMVRLRRRQKKSQGLLV